MLSCGHEKDWLFTEDLLFTEAEDLTTENIVMIGDNVKCSICKKVARVIAMRA